jgi:hypothetical protein
MVSPGPWFGGVRIGKGCGLDWGLWKGRRIE